MVMHVREHANVSDAKGETAQSAEWNGAIRHCG
jgi:hypothetical protein